MEPAKWPVGPHLLEFEPPDLCHCRVHGITQPSEVAETFRIIRDEIIPKVGDVYLIVHMKDGDGESLPSGTRQHLLSVIPPSRGTVIIGGSGIMRMAVNVIARSIMALSRKRLLIKVASTSEEALACIAEWRSASTGHVDE
jgi:hypothetical protein